MPPPHERKARPAPQFWGDSSRVTAAWGGVLEDTSKPWKSDKTETTSVPKKMERQSKRASRKTIEHLDAELGYFLKLEAFLKPRSPATMQALTGKAKRFLEKYDCSAMSYRDRYERVAAAVKFAMTIDETEDGVRQCLKSTDQDELRSKNSEFVIKGKVGHSGFKFPGFGSTSKLAA